MKTTVLLFLITLYSSLLYAQRPEGRIRDFVSENEIKEHMVFNIDCNYDIISDECLNRGPYYLFWEEEGNWNIKKFGCRDNFGTQQVNVPDSFRYYLSNLAQLKIQRKQAKSIENKRHKKKIEKPEPYGFVCHDVIKYYTSRLPTEWKVNRYFLCRGVMDPEYDTAAYLLIQPLFLWMDKTIEAFEDEGKFVKAESQAN